MMNIQNLGSKATLQKESPKQSLPKVTSELMPDACNLIEKDTLAEVFSYDFCEISKNTFFTEHFWTTASKNILVKTKVFKSQIIRQIFEEIK